MLLTIRTPQEMEALGRRIAALVGAGDVIALNGELGAGKTTLTRGLGEALGVRGPVTSPTFVLARSHPNLLGGPPLVHVDAYRLTEPAELDDLDLDFEASVVVVEWAEGMLDGMVESWLQVDLQRKTGLNGGEDTEVLDAAEPREVRITPHGPRWAGVVFE